MKTKLFLLLLAASLSQTVMAQNASAQQQTYDEIYSLMQDGGNYDIVRNLVVINDQSSDQVYCCWGDPGLPDINQGKFKSNQEQVANTWDALYKCIRRCNYFLETYNNADVATQQQCAEVRFLRAYFYSIALDLWGGVPIYTSSDVAETKARNTDSEVLDFIISELTDCQAALSEDATVDRYGKPTQGAAQLLLARLYLNAQVYSGTARWAEAKELAASLIHSGKYSLCNDYARLFMGDNNMNGAEREVVWPLVVDPNNMDNWGNTTFLIAATRSWDMPSSGLSECWVGNIVRLSLLRKFFPNDKCPSASTDYILQAAGDDRCLFYGVDRPYGSSPFASFYDGFSCVKYTNLRSDGTEYYSTHADTDFPLLRYAEVYLIHAEADARLNGGNCSAEGLQMLNTLRLRAHAASLSTASLETLADEWAREFYLEGRRRSDLIRFGMYSGNSYKWDGKGSTLHDLLPIPDSEMGRNPNCVQNPGYEDFSKKPDGLVMHTPAFADQTIDLSKVQGLWFGWERPTNFETDETVSYSFEVSMTADFTQTFMRDELENTETVLYNSSSIYQGLGYMGVSDGETVNLCARVICRGVATEPISFSVCRSKLSAVPFTWYILGSSIGDGSWNNSVNGLGMAVIPFGLNEQNNFRYAGYFNTEGFKMVRNLGQWDEQIGSYSGSVYDFVFNDGSSTNLQFDMPGNYILNIYDDGTSRYLYSERLSDDLPIYTTIGIIGDFNYWGADVNMIRVDRVVHTWYAYMSFDQDTSLKFRADNNWNVNWGNNGFPYGEGLRNGANIPVKAGDYIVFFNDITGDYLFLNSTDGVLPSVGGSETLVDGMYLNTDYATILGTGNVTFRVEDEANAVQVLDSPAGQRVASLQLLAGDYRMEVSTDGKVDKKYLVYFINQVSTRVVEIDVAANKRKTTVEAVLRGYCDKDDVRVYTQSAPFTITMEEDYYLQIADAYYYIGSMNDWKPDDRRMPLVQQQEGVFSITFTQEAGQENWFKVAPSTTTDWNGDFVYPMKNGESLGSGSFLTEGNDGAWYIPASDTEKTYTFTIDFTTMTYTLVEGAFSGVADSHITPLVTGVYSLSGMNMRGTTHRGLCIQRMSNGNWRKVLTK